MMARMTAATIVIGFAKSVRAQADSARRSYAIERTIDRRRVRLRS